MLGEVFIMPKFEIYPYINWAEIGEIEVTIDLTDEEVVKLKELSKEEFKKMITERAIVKITDFDVDYDTENLDSWTEVK